MLSEEQKTSEKPQYLKDMMIRAGNWYQFTKTTYPRLASGLSKVEPLMTPVHQALTKYALPMLDHLEAPVSTLVLKGSQGLDYVELTFAEKKDLVKAATKAWTQDHKNFSDYLEAVKGFYRSPWRENLNGHVVNFYEKSLNYQKPREMMRLAADMLSEGNDLVRGNMYLAWKQAGKFSVSEYLTSLRGMMGAMWDQRISENANIFAEISKLKNSLMLNKGLVQDWRIKAREAADQTSMVIFAGADELYFWTRETFYHNYPRVYDRIVVLLPLQQYVQAISGYFDEINRERIMAITWPEDVKGIVKPVMQKVGIEEWAMKNWAKLDNNEDGTVTLGDLYMTLGEIKQHTEMKYQQMWNKIRSVNSTNGEN